MKLGRHRWIAPLLALALLGPSARSWADLWVWERDLYVHEDVDVDYARRALDGANRLLQRQHDPEDVACPIELRVKELIRYGADTPGMVDRPGRLKPPSLHPRPGFYFHNGTGPAFAMAQHQLASLWVFERPEKVASGRAPPVRDERQQAWAVAHEWGHLARLSHIMRPRRAEVDDPATPENESEISDAPCTLMSYFYGFPSPPRMGVRCKSGKRIEAWQCEAYKRGADRVERSAP